MQEKERENSESDSPYTTLLIYFLVRSASKLQQLYQGGRLETTAVDSASFVQKLTHFGFAQELITSPNVGQDIVERIYSDGSITRLHSLDHLVLESMRCFS
jgi:hypothetical protein